VERRVRKEEEEEEDRIPVDKSLIHISPRKKAMNQKIIIGWCLGGRGLIHQARKKKLPKIRVG